MKYKLAKRAEQQIEMNIRQRMAELAAANQGIQISRFWRYPTMIRVKNREEARKLLAAGRREFDARFKGRMRGKNGGIV